MVDTVENRPRAVQAMPAVRAVTFADVKASLIEGLSDFAQAPAFGLAFGALYAAGGLAIVACVFFFELGYLAYPLFAGSVLIGPFVAAGLYDVSRELEAGRQPTWQGVLSTIFAQRQRELGWMAFVTIFAFIIWMYQVRLLLALFLGFASFATLNDFLKVLFTTSDGIAFLAVGHVIGAALALGLFSITVISFPLLMDRDLDVVTAMITSVQAVLTSPGPMILWGICVVALIAIGTAPAFLGLIFVLPVLGHATWHLYRRAVAPLP
ncbi:DUF2189 domain-containing protein [Xanthobacter aminoxidans]|uniref:DUF2189 domain-containing protein n=1 Tax=Xanthobacter aminoxidans TaxID=186280 RepID=UPI002022F74D|nr:DUF2189 domain-containing protein [Xanthobacter aminoxidans]MCL8382720.1 DUF2189 domain-containing protein [Xanthobacter aminoxidans]